MVDGALTLNEPMVDGALTPYWSTYSVNEEQSEHSTTTGHCGRGVKAILMKEKCQAID